MNQRIVHKRTHRNEQSVLGMIARIESGERGLNYGFFQYPAIAGCLAAVCAITGENFGEACDRLHIAKVHRTEMLNLDTPSIARIRALATPKASIATTTSPGPLRRAEQSVLGMIARIESGERGPSYGFFQYPAIAGRLATICEITGENFRKACDRLHIAPVHRTEILKVDTPVGQRLRAFAASKEISEAMA
jgi:hypothetical protein